MLWAVSMGYEEGKQKHGEDSVAVVMVLADSWSMVQAVEGAAAAPGPTSLLDEVVDVISQAAQPAVAPTDVVPKQVTVPPAFCTT